MQDVQNMQKMPNLSQTRKKICIWRLDVTHFTYFMCKMDFALIFKDV
jgi:hypothetical protein